ncbi:uncharacterized protein K489DRAFT_374151 [Dissoconium aciculare CBS 342.82]|uniref:HET-domain-containing protein n=1 Tax=Dissoconium aciculare CBS 342.82 TaxID=1314786 RepID=A0A6J3LRU3_9PEZI|nr:uncharacterized protein K489DRAFT_374151 [Dissoconium aciculare CBS 342.82]KAF1818520.1 hypothetical protein K489DRAFT_374151 [Dissoconium aciculare CBS 342.82]
MRLLNVNTLTFTEFLEDKTRPRYAIVSHRWGNEEVTFEDVQEGRKKSSAGYQKVEAFVQYVRDNIKPVCWLWIDTCCINKKDAVELSYAINSMFRWYRNAELCIAQLASIATGTLPSDIGQDEWFRRGWTLQELLAPRLVVFLTKDWRVIGSKGSSLYHYEDTFVGPDLGAEISSITRIPKRILDDWEASIDVRARDKMLWMEGRTTSREEDIVYALFGIVGVTLSIIYGERESNAKQRLLAELHRRNEIDSQHKERFQKITQWLRPADPWTNHKSARELHEERTGEWLLQTKEYQAWKSGEDQCLWLYGGAGCGKTVLCSTAIEDMKAYCDGKGNVGHAIFYFSFSDERKQSYDDLLTSLVAQLGHREPAFSILQQMYDKIDRKPPGQGELEKILHTALASYERFFCHLDALDECPEENEARQRMLENIERLLRQAPNMHLIATSRDELGIRDAMEQLGVKSICLTGKKIDSDIQRYVSKQLARIPKLSRLDAATKELVETTLTEKADGMFRWVFCQLQELSKSKRTTPMVVKAALLALPATLDETYERMLQNIAAEDQAYALTLLRWLTYSQTPLRLDEVAEISTIVPGEDPAADDIVDIDNRGGLEDVLDILAGLVVMVEAEAWTENAATENSSLGDISKGNNEVNGFSRRLIEKDTKIRLAHFSVKEYLESTRIKGSVAQSFRLVPTREHRWITQSCLVYLMHYSTSEQKASSKQDLIVFPLLNYAAAMWYRHALLQEAEHYRCEIQLLESKTHRADWLKIHKPDKSWKRPFDSDHYDDEASSLYYASFIGRVGVVQLLLEAKADVNAQGGRFGNALQAASFEGHETVVQLLLEAKADVNAQGGALGNALQAASFEGHETVVQLLLEAKADLLLEAKADVNAQGGAFGNALQAASSEGHETVVQLLLFAGAINKTGEDEYTED